MKKSIFFIVLAVLLGGFLLLNRNYRSSFDAVQRGYAAEDGYTVNLDAGLDTERLARMLYANSYVDNREDANFVASFLTAKFRGDTLPEALSDLNRRIWQLPAQFIERSGTSTYRRRLHEAQAQLGLNATVQRLYASDSTASVADGSHGGDGCMTVEVFDPKPTDSISWLDRMLRRTRVPAAGVWVRLNHHHLDADSLPTARTLAYARTDGRGRAVFRGLSKDSSYSVLQIRDGYSFGAAKGTYLGTLGAQMEAGEDVFSFTSSPHSLRIFPTDRLRVIREDGRITVRTPETFRHILSLYMAVFIAAWLVLFAVGNTGGRRMDNVLSAVLMLMTGLGMLFMFGINDPLTERLLGVETARGAIGGVVFMTLLLWFDVKRFLQGGYRLPFDFLKGLLTGCVRLPFLVLDFLGLGRVWHRLHTVWSSNATYHKATEGLTHFVRQVLAVPGIGYMLTALLLTVLVDLVGEAVGGMKVNLNLGFVTVQPSEVTKFLLVVFMAVFWYEKGDAVIAYSQPAENGNLVHAGQSFRRKLLTMAGILGSLAVLILMYLKLSDMGPALVVSLTFIILYSLVKSRTAPEGDARQIMHTDLFMLAVGVVSFIGFMYVGYLLGLMPLAALLWLLVWLLYGWTARRRIYESPVMFNLIVFLFVCGTDVLTALGRGDIAQRLYERNQMCVNTWGTIGGEPGVNTQVAEGLWGLASGGLTGQGLGNAKAHYIPAFHTDMILQSIGELTGLVGLAAVIILLSLVLRRSILAGYRSGHPFVMYLCSGIAIVTGVQFFIISLGSLGVIPLTGVTVPFLSYGKVSLILNCMAFGIVLSVSARCTESSTHRTRAYNDTLGVLTLFYGAAAVFVLAVIAAYQTEPVRSHTLVRPVYVYDNSGAAVIRYNPRIGHLTSRMRAGDILDRNGVLLATSSPEKLLSDTLRRTYRVWGLGDVRDLTLRKQKRYYPFGNHLYFMLGNANSGLYFSSLEKSPYGYLAEGQHMSELRGYDNRLLDADGKPVTADLHSDRYRNDRFMPDGNYDVVGYQLRDYSVLLPFLKEGDNLLDRYNHGEDTGVGSNLGGDVNVTPRDIRLTLDAHLQTKLQQRIPDYLVRPDAVARLNKANRRYERYSIVVLDALGGDLLASAVWPLPDENRIVESDGAYDDDGKPVGWTAFTERDLGLTHATNPGSTAKIMSALAGLIHMDSVGARVEHFTYPVYRDERIHNRGRGQEPPVDSYVATVDMRQAIVQSSNVYFINLVNKHGLYRELAEVYGWGGIRIGMKDPYKLRPSSDSIPAVYLESVLSAEGVATRRYADYVAQRGTRDGVIRRMQGNDGRFTSDYWTWAWGEGTLDATPVAMARVAAAAATGSIPETRFLMDEKTVRHSLVRDKHNIAKLREYMKQEARSLGNPDIGGKTGTPERLFRGTDSSEAVNRNDGWYICFIDNATIPGGGKGGQGKLAVAVRVERTMSVGSAYAKDVVRHVVLPVLEELKYIRPRHP